MKKPSSFFKSLSPVVSVLAATLILSTGCAEKSDMPSDPTTTQETSILDQNNPQIQAVIAIQNRHTESLMANPEVVGTATGLTDGGKPAILVFTKTDIMSEALRKGAVAPIAVSLEGIPVVVQVTGPIVAADGGPNHRIPRTRPIPLGISGGNAGDNANGFCCSGTLGALLKDFRGRQYILSNSHVLAHDTNSSSRDPDIARIGDPIVQPGLIDNNCQTAAWYIVGRLSTTSSLVSGSNVDAAVAEVFPGYVRSDGAILDIGTISRWPRSASIAQRVKKSGRTTGLTRSTIVGIHGTFGVTYDNECNGEKFTKSFTGQLIIQNSNCNFLQPGDSGSLLVEDVSINPQAIGLLFAASMRDENGICPSNPIAIANPIHDVLNYLSQRVGVTLSPVGNY